MKPIFLTFEHYFKHVDCRDDDYYKKQLKVRFNPDQSQVRIQNEFV